MNYRADTINSPTMTSASFAPENLILIRSCFQNCAPFVQWALVFHLSLFVAVITCRGCLRHEWDRKKSCLEAAKLLFRTQQMGTQDAIGVLFDQNLEGSISLTGPAGRIPAGSVCLLGSKTQVKLPGVFFQQTHTSEGRNSEHDGRNAYVVWFHVVSPQKIGCHDLAFIAGNRSQGQSTACGSIPCCIEGRV